MVLDPEYEYAEAIPKPMIKIGDKPILYHMNYYASYGHNEFIIALDNQKLLKITFPL